MSQRIYVQTAIFGVPITGLRHLWEPSTQYRGQATQKPNYMTSIVIPKTAGHWSQEPVMAGFTAACQELYAKALSHIPFPQVIWPVKDGDTAEPGKAPVEWMKGRWFLNGSSSSPINVDIIQAGVPIKLVNRSQVKAGDIVTLSGALAVKTNDPRGVKFYANNVLFMGPGEEIAVGNGTTGLELMERAKAQGLAISGFTPGHVAGFRAPAQGGFAAPPPNGGFAPPAPSTFPPAPQGGFVPPPSTPAPGGAFAPPPAPPPAPGGGFAPPTGFAPPR